MIAANHLYNRVKPDGLTIGAWASPLVLQHIMGNDAAQFDGRKFGYLGTPSPYDTVCTFNDKSGITKMEDWINSRRPQKISAIGPGTSTSDIPKLLKAALNLPMDVIDGYKGGADARLAVESAEVDGYCGSWGTVETVWRSAYESKKIVPVLQVARKSQPKYKQIPLANNYAKTDEARELLKIADDVPTTAGELGTDLVHAAGFEIDLAQGSTVRDFKCAIAEPGFASSFRIGRADFDALRSRNAPQPVRELPLGGIGRNVSDHPIDLADVALLELLGQSRGGLRVSCEDDNARH